MNVGCSAIPCPIILNSTCVIYEGGNLIYTDIPTWDNGTWTTTDFNSREEVYNFLGKTT